MASAVGTKPVEVLNSIDKPVEISKETSFFSFTDVKIKKYALIAFSIITAGGASALVCSVILGSVSWPFLAVSIPLLFFASEFYKTGSLIKDYKNPDEIKLMKESAESMSFTAVRKEHRGIQKALQYEIVSLEELQGKFRKEFGALQLSQIFETKGLSLSYVLENELMPVGEITAKFKEELDSFEELDDFFEKYSFKDLDVLLGAGVLTQGQRDELARLHKEKKKCINEFKSDLLKLDSLLAGRSERILKDLESRIASLKKDPKVVDMDYSLDDGLEKGKGASLSISQVEDLQRLEREKLRVKNVKVGSALQTKYIQEKEDLELKYSNKEVEIDSQFEQFKLTFESFN